MTNKHTVKMQEWNVMQTVTKNGGLNPENTIVTSWAQGALRIIPDILPNAMMFNMLNTESYKPPMMIINLNILRPQTNVLCDNQGSGEGYVNETLFFISITFEIKFILGITIFFI